MAPPTKAQAARKRVRAQTAARTPWFELEGTPAARAVFQRVTALRAGPLASYRSNVVRRMQLYAGSRNVNGVTGNDIDGAVLRNNVLRSVVGTGAAVVGSARTLPFAQSRGADWKLRRKSALFNRAIQQQFADVGVFDRSRAVVVDGLVTGLGLLKFYSDPSKPGGMVGCERTLPNAVVWDPAEATTPEGLTQLWEIRLVNRDVLAGLYPDSADEICRAAGPSALDVTDFFLRYGGAKSNQCVVIEAWHLPSADGAGDGKHGVYVSTGELTCREWTRPRFPFARLPGWEPAMIGWSGTSMIELAEPAQQRLEELQEYTDASQRLGSKLHVIIEGDSGVTHEDIDNLPVRILRVKPGANPPRFEKIDATPHDMEASYDRVRDQLLQMFGLNVSQVQGEKPAGVNSAVALNAMEEITSKRHVMNIRNVEAYYLECAWCLIDANDELAGEAPAFAVDAAARGAWLDSSKWLEIRPSDTEAKVAVFPMSALMGSPASFYQVTSEQIQMGYLTPQTAKLLMGQPDVEGQTDEDTVDQQYAEALCELIEGGERVAVDPYADAAQVMQTMRTNYISAKRQIKLGDKEGQAVLGEYRRVLDALRAKTEQAAAAQSAAAPPTPPPAGPAPELPGAMPMA